MSGYFKNNDKWHLATDFIDDYGIGMLDRHTEVYCSIYFCFDEDEEKYCSVFPILYIRDTENYIESSYLYMDKVAYRDNGPMFSFSKDQRDRLCRLLRDKQFYGMSGWDYCMRSIAHECELREMDFTPWTMPDYGELPIKEEGFKTETEKLFCEELGEYDSVEVDFRYDIGDGCFIVAMPLREPSPLGFYFKVIKVDMTDPEEFLDERKIISWCRISMERAEYITGYDECLELTDEQIERMYHPNRDAGDITITKK